MSYVSKYNPAGPSLWCGERRRSGDSVSFKTVRERGQVSRPFALNRATIADVARVFEMTQFTSRPR